MDHGEEGADGTQRKGCQEQLKIYGTEAKDRLLRESLEFGVWRNMESWSLNLAKCFIAHL